MPRQDLDPNDPVFSRRFQVEGLPDGKLDLQGLNALVQERIGTQFNPLAYAKEAPHNPLRVYIAAWVLASNVENAEFEEALDHGGGGFVDVWSEHIFVGAMREARKRFLDPKETEDLITTLLRVLTLRNFYEAYNYFLTFLTLPGDAEAYQEKLDKIYKAMRPKKRKRSMQTPLEDSVYRWEPLSVRSKAQTEHILRRMMYVFSQDLTPVQFERFALHNVEVSFHGDLDMVTIDRLKSYLAVLRDPVFSCLMNASVTERTVRSAVSMKFNEAGMGGGLWSSVDVEDGIQEEDKEAMYRSVLARLGYEDVERALDLLLGNYYAYLTENGEEDYTFEAHEAAHPDMTPQELRRSYVGQDRASILKEEGAQIRRHILESATDEELRVLTYIKPQEQYEPEGDLLDYDSLASALTNGDYEDEDVDMSSDGEGIDTAFVFDQGDGEIADLEILEDLWESAPASVLGSATIDEEIAEPSEEESEESDPPLENLPAMIEEMNAMVEGMSDSEDVGTEEE